jgi:hypothetical protein
MVPPLVFPLFGPPHVSGILRFTLLKLLLSGVWLLTLDSYDISSYSSGGSVLTDILVFRLFVNAVDREVMFAGALVPGSSSMLLLEVTDWVLI